MTVTSEAVMQFLCPSEFREVFIIWILELEELSLMVWALRRRIAVGCKWILRHFGTLHFDTRTF